MDGEIRVSTLAQFGTKTTKIAENNGQETVTILLAGLLIGLHPRQKVLSTKMADTKSIVFISIDHFFEF